MDRKILDDVRMAYTDLLNALDDAADNADEFEQAEFFCDQLDKVEALVRQYDSTVEIEQEQP